MKTGITSHLWNARIGETSYLAEFTRNILLFIDGYAEVYGKSARKYPTRLHGARWRQF